MRRVEIELLATAGYDEVLDVRSPGEFAEDHIPGAINVPVLNDAQRAEVGHIYKNVSPFDARRLGAGYVSANIGALLGSHFASKTPEYRPLVYCWRGGQRSASLAHVLERIGWNVHVLEHGYKSYRRLARTDLAHLPVALSFHVLAGLTGTGKTDVLAELAALGEQVLDLEGIANHQGSLLGEPPGGQNVNQKWFESQLWDALRRFDPMRPVWTEAESAKIGSVICPKELLHRIREGRVFELEASRAERSRYLCRGYQWWRENPEVLMEKLEGLAHRHGHAEIAKWRALAKAGHWEEFVDRLLFVHYDPSYSHSRDRSFASPMMRVRVEGLLERGCAVAAKTLAGSA